MQSIIEILKEEKGLLKEDEDIQIVDLGDDIPAALIKRSDIGSLWIARDLGAVIWGKETYNKDKIYMLLMVKNIKFY